MTSFLGELRRRNVVKVAVAYAIVGWILVEVSSVMGPALNLPEWATSFVAFLLILGFPVALILSWAYELTPDGMERTKSVPLSDSITHVTGRKLDFAIIALLVVAVGYLVIANYVVTEPATDAVMTEEQRSIAVLPFDNRSARAEDQFFVDGMHDDILTQLARIASLKVISRTSVMGYRDTNKNMRTIGEELGVATILEGGVQRSGDTVRINVQLIDSATDDHLWAETYDRELTAENVFAIQSEVATAIADALQASLSPEEVERLNDVPTQSTRALNFYLSGNDYYKRSDDSTFKPLAAEMYERAVADDPEFALAWAALSRTHTNLYFYAVDPTSARLVLAEDAARRALQIAPDLPEAHLALGSYYDQGLHDYERAAQELAIAGRTQTDDPDVIERTSYMLRRMGDWQGAVVGFRRLIDRDPRNSDLLFQIANTFLWLRDYTEAERYYELALELTPDDSLAYVFKAYIPWYRDGDVRLLREAGDNPAVPIGEYSAYLGWNAAIYERDYEAALGYLDRLDIEAFSEQSLYAPISLLYGQTYALAAQNDLATHAFEEALAHTHAALAANPEDPRLHVALARALIGPGDSEAAEAAARQALELIPRSRDDLTGSFHQITVVRDVYAPSGNVEALVEELDAMLAAPSAWSIEGLLPDPRFDPVRDDPRFTALVEKYRRQ